MSRRAVLAGVGAGGASLALPGTAWSLGEPPPRRVLFYVTSHGTVYDQWRMRPAGVGDGDDFALDLLAVDGSAWSPILAPLQPWADRLLVLDGVGSATALAARYNEHRAGNAACQTGRVPYEVPGAWSQTDGPSLDQHLAALQDTAFRSLELNVGGAPVSYDARGYPLPFETNPLATWRRLFPAVAPAETSQGAMLERVAARYERLGERLGGDAGAPLDVHRALIEDLVHRLDLLAAARCAAPPPPEPAPDLQDAAYPESMVQAFLDLVVTAFACDLTRVVTLRVDAIPPATVDAPPGDLHTDVAHAVPYNPVAAEIMTRYHTFHAQQVAWMLALLGAIPEGGGSMLDHTLIVWHNEMATGEHAFDTVPYVIAGGTGTFSRGRYVRWAPRAEIDGLWYPQRIGVPHNRALATIAEAMGAPVDGFGAESVLDTSGQPVDCTGALDRVT